MSHSGLARIAKMGDQEFERVLPSLSEDTLVALWQRYQIVCSRHYGAAGRIAIERCILIEARLDALAQT